MLVAVENVGNDADRSGVVIRPGYQSLRFLPLLHLPL
jgi:hypothetical protein